jgi:hypothetical protein
MAKVIKGLNEEQTEIIYNGLDLSGWYDCDYSNLFTHITETDLIEAANQEFDNMPCNAKGSKDTKVEGNFLVTTLIREFDGRVFSTTYRQCMKNDHIYEKEFSNIFKEVK